MLRPQLNETERARAHTRARRFAMMVLLFLFVFTHRGILSQNDLSRYVAANSLATRGTFAIDGSPYAQMMIERDGREYRMMNDIVRNPRDGRLYSSKPPVQTLVLAGVLKVFHLMGADFSFVGSEAAVPTFLLTWLTVGTVTALGFYAFRRKLSGFTKDAEGDLVTVFVLGGTIFLSYSTSLNNHTVGATLIIISFFLLGMGEARKEVSLLRVAAAGFLMAVASVIDIGPGFIFSVAFALYIVFYMHSWKALVAFGLGGLPPLAVHCAVQYSIWGSVLPVQMQGRLARFPGSYWQNPVGPDAWDIPRWKYWLLTLFSGRGLFIVSPVLLVGAAGLAEELRRAWRGPVESRGERAGQGYVALTVLFGMVFLVWYFGFRVATNFGGSCFGFRWYMGFVPLLSWYAARYYARHRKEERFWRLFIILGLVSLMYALIGMQEPWTLMENNPHPAARFLMAFRGF
ncbi:MAG: hypothetical protein R6X33_13840 [Candidatus Brocadiia bacterium]